MNTATGAERHEAFGGAALALTPLPRHDKVTQTVDGFKAKADRRV